VAEVQLVADYGPHHEGCRVGRNRERQLHHAPDRDWLRQDPAEPALGNANAASVPGDALGYR